LKSAWNFVKTALLGGFVVILPAAIIVTVFAWMFGIVTRLIRPLTAVLVERSEMGQLMADLLVIGLIVGFCFALGLAVRTAAGRLLQRSVESRLEKFAPGYRLIKETLLLFLGRKKSPFLRVALVRLYGSDALTTAFVTEEHGDGTVTVFVPTSPNPTSGLIFHLKGEHVLPSDASVETAMRTVIACGVGSEALLGKMKTLEKGGG
jgi:uncharacterized membrane protein